MNPFQQMLLRVIVETYYREQLHGVGDLNNHLQIINHTNLAMKVRFELPIPNGFDGYRELTMILYCPTGSTYTQVWTRESSTIAPYSPEKAPKVRGKHVENSTAWTKIADDSSCGVEKVLDTPGIRGLITGGKGNKGWYNLVEVPDFNKPAGER